MTSRWRQDNASVFATGWTVNFERSIAHLVPVHQITVHLPEDHEESIACGANRTPRPSITIGRTIWISGIRKDLNDLAAPGLAQDQ